MSVKLKSKIRVSTNLSDPSIQNYLFCQVLNFNNEIDGYRINGNYFYETVNEETVENTIVKQFSHTMTNAEIDNLYQALNVQYPTDATYTEKRELEIYAGLRYILSGEPIFGLSGSDWE